MGLYLTTDFLDTKRWHTKDLISSCSAVNVKSVIVMGSFFLRSFSSHSRRLKSRILFKVLLDRSLRSTGSCY